MKFPTAAHLAPSAIFWFFSVGRLGANEIDNFSFQSPDHKVLHAIEVERNDRTIRYERVVPPVLPKASAKKSQEIAGENFPASDDDAKRHEVLMVFATVQPDGVTELRWNASGQTFLVWSNINFNDLTALNEIKTPDAVYLFIFAIQNFVNTEKTDDLDVRTAQRPTRSSFSATRSEYVVANTGITSPPVEAMAPLDALHSFFDANRERIREAVARIEAERIARLQAPTTPTVHKKTVIRFWPKASRNYPTAK